MHFDLLSATVLIVFVCGCVFSFFYFKLSRCFVLCLTGQNEMWIVISGSMDLFLFITIFSYYFQFSLSIMPFFSSVCFFCEKQGKLYFTLLSLAEKLIC